MSDVRYLRRDSLIAHGSLTLPKGKPSRLIVYAIDLDDLLDVHASDYDRYQRAERLLMHYAAEEQRLRPALHDGKVRPDTERLPTRDEIDRVANVMMNAWAKAEGQTVNVSFVATFVDMANAVLWSLRENGP